MRKRAPTKSETTTASVTSRYCARRVAPVFEHRKQRFRQTDYDEPGHKYCDVRATILMTRRKYILKSGFYTRQALTQDTTVYRGTNGNEKHLMSDCTPAHWHHGEFVHEESRPAWNNSNPEQKKGRTQRPSDSSRSNPIHTAQYGRAPEIGAEERTA